MNEILVHGFNGLVNGGYYALLALGLAIIFGMLRVINFAHGALYMLGAFAAVVAFNEVEMNFWVALLVVPVTLGLLGMVLERLFVQRLAALEPLYNFLLTFGLALIFQGLIESRYGVASQRYYIPKLLDRSLDLKLFDFPAYQVFVLLFSVTTCGCVWLLLANTRIGIVVRASTERPEMTKSLGVNVGRWVTPVFGFGVFLAGVAGVLAAPMRAVNSNMGADLIIVVFAVVVIGGLGSILGSILGGFGVGLLEALGNLYVPALSNTVVFLLMAFVLLIGKSSLFGEEGAPV